jgi:wyosine [tRNA(Phe)-imidazoG37] synthetase (radical SAM superfamily)
VRRALRRADLIIPSLDAATPRVFEKINRPLKGITIDKIINGLIRLRKEFKGKIWLEIMVVRGINDTLDEAFRLREAVAKIKPDKVQLNIPVRPAWADIALPDKERVREIAKIIGGNIEIIARFNKKPRKQSGGDAANVIIEFLKRRPANLSDLEKTLGISRLRLNRSLRDLISRGKIKEKMAHGEKYFIFCGAKNKI